MTKVYNTQSFYTTVNRHGYFESRYFGQNASQIGGQNQNIIAHFAELLSKNSHLHVFMHASTFCKVVY